MASGEERAWELLDALQPEQVSRRAMVRYEEENARYVLPSLGWEFAVSPPRREIAGLTPGAAELRARTRYFLDVSILWYLVGAKEVGRSGRLIRPQDLKGGHHFFTGTHELPLTPLAMKYGADREGFLARARSLGGRQVRYGDAAVELSPMPRIPLTVILWLGDEEFPSRADLLFDSSAALHVPLDINWSLAMMSLIALL
ncbi:MAG: DUF3786 domain-containing protein [Nitrospirota bacterium]|jgi:hypothetical protein